ncbi:odorant receptor 88a [Drosophila miranda]|uniref:odorant receptor 88a n=1 Tax=Drosophila miranda TaxID=7229 RepID=UPI0007E5E0D1|nr:odorant receptor 88a [Drosophila miranda]XP_033245884.1 odorant receptor 88a [Drosophila miranda]
MKNTETRKPIKMEDFLRPQMFQQWTRMVHFAWKRDGSNRLVKSSSIGFWISAVLNLVFFAFNGWDIIGHLMMGKPTNQNPPVLCITIYFSIRGLMLFLKRREIINFVYALDRECPVDIDKQHEIRLERTYSSFWMRYRFLRAYAHLGLPMFCCLPLAVYLLTNDGLGAPITLHQQLLGGWMPFDLRRNPRFYLLVWLFDVSCTACGVSFFLTFDNLFNVMQGHLIMHLNHLCRQLEAIDPAESVTNEVEFFAGLRTLVQRQQLLNRLCGQYNDIFKVAFLVSNFMGSGSLCFYLFMIAETTDIFMIIQYILPTMVLVAFTFEICLRGTQLEEASARLESSLRHQTWYMGSRRYRKFFLLWLQYSQRSQKLGAFGLIEINMVHFTDIMQLAFRLFTFLRSQ